MSTPGQPADHSRLDGFLVVDKPVGPSSMKAVARVRWCARQNKADCSKAGRTRTGHAGTLDPLASGVLVLGLGRATKHLQEAMATDKVYETTIDLAGHSATFDAEMPAEPVAIDQPPATEAIEAALKAFRGPILQAPPAFSAVNIDGQRAYHLARKGQQPDIPPRPVHVHALELLDYTWPLVTLRIHCAKGFYVRALARDLGAALGTGGWCTTIRRTAVGPFTIEQATALDKVPDMLQQAHLISLDELRALLAQDTTSS